MREPNGALLLPPPPRGFVNLEPDGLTRTDGRPPRLHYVLDRRPYILTPTLRLLPQVRGAAVTASGNYYEGFEAMYMNDEAVDWLADQFMLALFTNSLSPNFGTDTFYGVAPLNANEVGSPAGGVALAGRSINNVSSVLTFDGNDTAWGSQTFSGAVCDVLYDNTLTNKVALCLNYFGGPFGPTSGVFTILHNSAGLHTNDLY